MRRASQRMEIAEAAEAAAKQRAIEQKEKKDKDAASATSIPSPSARKSMLFTEEILVEASDEDDQDEGDPNKTTIREIKEDIANLLFSLHTVTFPLKSSM